MTEDKNFNKWLKEYNPEQIKVFEETDLKIAYLQGCADEVEKWEKVNADLRKQLEVAKDLIHQFLIQNPISVWLPKKAEQFLKEADNDRKAD